MPPSSQGSGPATVTIEMSHVPELPSEYHEKHRVLSSCERHILVRHKGAAAFSTIVPAGIFNPYGGIAAHKLLELILDDVCAVWNRQVVDLGCGSGVIGLASILRGAKSVLFSDINPRVLPLRDHAMLRECDRVGVQDLLANETSGSHDLVIMSTPTNVADEVTSIASDSYESGILRTPDFFHRLVTDAHRCLRAGGMILFWIKIPIGTKSFDDLCSTLSIAGFERSSFKVHWEAFADQVGVGTHPDDSRTRHLIIEATKRG